MMSDEVLRGALRDYLRSRRTKNPNYSLRAMSRQFKVSPAQLSQIISGKRKITAKIALLLADRLGYSPIEKAYMMDIDAPPVAQRILEEDQFKVISDWYHYAILSLSQVKDNKADVRWIAKRLGIDVITAREAYMRLKKLKYLEESDGKFRQSSVPLTTAQDVPSSAVRKFHKQKLALAAEKLEEVPVELREFGAITFPVNLAKLPNAKKLIRKFRNDLYKYLEAGEKQEVYTLAIQLFPLTKGEE